MALRDVLVRLSGEAQRNVERLFDRWRGGGLSEQEFITAVAAVIARADQRATTVADRAAALQLSKLLSRQVNAVPTDLADQQSRLRQSLRTLLDERPDVAPEGAALAESQRRRLGRLARAEPLQRGQEAVQGHLRREGAGWTRALGADPCPLCEEWADGQVRPAEINMPRHPNCSCVQRAARL